jgi:hypothetical protein
VEIPTLYTASAMAKFLGVPEAKAKEATKEIGFAPVARKSCCAFYGTEEMAKLVATLK